MKDLIIERISDRRRFYIIEDCETYLVCKDLHKTVVAPNNFSQSTLINKYEYSEFIILTPLK